LFIGHCSSTIDNRSHLSLPTEYLGFLQEGVYITKGFDKNLLVLTTSAFQEVYECVMALEITNPLTRLLLRLLLGNAVELNLNGANMIPLSPSLMKFADLKQDAILVGQGDYFEIWDPELWEQQEIELQNTQANTHRFSTLKIATR
jgi:MraZ protein